MKRILLASRSFDRWHTYPVARFIKKHGWKATIYEADRVVAQQDELRIHIAAGQKPKIHYKGELFRPELFAAAWYRRPNEFRFFDAKDVAKQASLDTQYRGLQKFLWDAVPDRAWLNSPAAMRVADNKLEQLAVAASLGFTIPETIVANNWQPITGMTCNTLTFKMVEGTLDTKNGLKVLHSTILPNTIEGLPITTNPYPGIWQHYISKAREWRITVVGDQTFDVAIYTDSRSRHDWREHQRDKSSVQFKAECFPDEYKKKCLQFMRHYGLQYGAFDFIETPDGDMVFLELNENGQYAWLEDTLSLPITQAIAEELVKIASEHK